MKNSLTNRPESTDFFKTALKLKGSITPKVIKTVVFFMLYALIISIIGHFKPQIALPIGPFEYGGLIMGLVLVFRINSGYDRWWEARKLWGNIVNQTRNLSIIIMSYTNNDDTHWQVKMCGYISALPFLIKSHLRSRDLLIEVQDFLSQDILNLLQHSENRPNLLSLIISQELQLAKTIHGMDGFSFLKADDQREQILNAQGACERILSTPMPLVMAIKARRFILLFLVVLPFALINISVFITPWILFLVAYALLSLDQISIELQNPFSEKNLSHLPLDQICQTIAKNLLELQKTIMTPNASEI